MLCLLRYLKTIIFKLLTAIGFALLLSRAIYTLYTKYPSGVLPWCFWLNPAPYGRQRAELSFVLRTLSTEVTRWTWTMRGTAHVFPISPYGGSVGKRTYASQRLVNHECRSGWYDTPSFVVVPSRLRPAIAVLGNGRQLPNSRLPTYSHLTVVIPFVQLYFYFIRETTGNSGVPTFPDFNAVRELSSP